MGSKILMSWPIRKTAGLLAAWLLFGSSFPGQVQDSPDVQVLLGEMKVKASENSKRLENYTFRMKHSEQELDDRGNLKKETVRVFQTFPVHGHPPVQLLLSENGKDLSAEKLAKEKSNADKEWRRRRRDEAKEPVTASVPLSYLDNSQVAFVRNQRHHDRDIFVLALKPLANDKATKDRQRLWAKFQGELWVDARDKKVVRLEVKMAEGYSPSGLSGLSSSLQPGSTLLIESAPLADNLWAVVRLEFRSEQKNLGRTIHFRQVDEFTDYKPFDKDADQLP